MTINPRSILANGLFADATLSKNLQDGRTPWSLAALGGISDLFSFPILPAVMKLLMSPYWVPPSWLPAFPFALENPVDPTAWIGSVGNAPMDPRDDPFYHPDASRYTNLKPGEVIDIREVGLSAIWVNIKKAYQISYRTENTFGAAAADVTTVMIPNNPNGKVVSYQMWEDSCSLQCSPSYSVVTGVSDPTIDLLFILGFVVNFPDHEGVKSSFACGIREGKSTTDSIRAFLSSKEKMGLNKNSFDKIVMWGYSGGSIATGHSVEAMNTYAPDLVPHIKGALVGGFVNNLTQVMSALNGGIFAGFSAAGMYGLSTEYDGIAKLLDAHLRPGLKNRFNYVHQRCVISNLMNFIFQNVFGYTDDSSGKTIMGDPSVVEAIKNEWLGYHNAPTNIPMMVYQGVQDEIVDIDGVDRVVDFWCSKGVHVDYYRLGLGAHITTEIVSILDGIRYVYKFFDGYTPGSCKSKSDAIKGTSMFYSPTSGNYQSLVAGDWKGSGVLAQLKKEGLYNGTI